MPIRLPAPFLLVVAPGDSAKNVIGPEIAHERVMVSVAMAVARRR